MYLDPLATKLDYSNDIIYLRIIHRPFFLVSFIESWEREMRPKIVWNEIAPQTFLYLLKKELSLHCSERKESILESESGIG